MAQKKKEYKKPDSYKQKCLYLDEENEYQSECIAILDLCGHKQAKFLGLLVHDYITRNRIDIKSLNKEIFKKYMTLLEMQTINSHAAMMMIPMNPMMMTLADNMAMSQPIKPVKQKGSSKVVGESDFIDQQDMNDMNEALAAFGV